MARLTYNARGASWFCLESKHLDWFILWEWGRQIPHCSLLGIHPFPPSKTCEPQPCSQAIIVDGSRAGGLIYGITHDLLGHFQHA